MSLCSPWPARRRRAGVEDDAGGEPKPAPAILIVMNEVVDRLCPKIRAASGRDARRLTVMRGLVGIGS